MPSKMILRYALVCVSVCVLGCPIWAQSTEVAESPDLKALQHTLTITVTGQFGPLLEGPDFFHLDAKPGKLTLAISESLSPTKVTATSATYALPAGAIEAGAGKERLSTKSPAKMVVNLTKTADILTLIFHGPDSTVYTVTVFLEKGSWTTAVLKHPAGFAHSPQKLTAAKTVDSPGCRLEYARDGLTTYIGFDGTAWSSVVADKELPEPEAGQYDMEQ